MSHISEHDKDHIYEILQGHGDWFSADLIRLIAKADEDNLAAFRQAFPFHVAAYEAWFYKQGRYASRKDDP